MLVHHAVNGAYLLNIAVNHGYLLVIFILTWVSEVFSAVISEIPNCDVHCGTYYPDDP
jgi:hypothetical protein